MTVFPIFEKLFSFSFRIGGPMLSTSIGSSSGSSLHSSLRTALGGSWAALLFHGLSGMAEVGFSIVSDLFGFFFFTTSVHLSCSSQDSGVSGFRFSSFGFDEKSIILGQSLAKCPSYQLSQQLGHQPLTTTIICRPSCMIVSVISWNTFLFKQTRKE